MSCSYPVSGNVEGEYSSGRIYRIDFEDEWGMLVLIYNTTAVLMVLRNWTKLFEKSCMEMAAAQRAVFILSPPKTDSCSGGNYGKLQSIVEGTDWPKVHHDW